MSNYVLDFDGGRISMDLSRFVDRSRLAGPLRNMNGKEPWSLSITRLPEGLDYQDFLDQGLEETAFIQAGGRADCMTIEIRQPGGSEWGVDSVQSVVGHPVSDKQTLDVPITMPAATQMVSRSEVFEAEEAADIFFHYFKTGELADGYVLRPIQGWTADNTSVDLRDKDV
jgi:hypothetical protein